MNCLENIVTFDYSIPLNTHAKHVAGFIHMPNIAHVE